MNKHSSLRTGDSLLERAAELYGFGQPAARPSQVEPQVQPRPEPEEPVRAAPPTAAPRVARAPSNPARRGVVDRDALRERGFIVPDEPVGALAEEFRIIKRQLLVNATPGDIRTILVCSAQPDEGKTFCALNLALSLAAEREVEVLLVDADFPKPEILSLLGLEDGPGLVDALTDRNIDPERLVIATDVPGLSVLSAGTQVNNVTELLASERTREVLDRLTANRPNRIVIFDSPPALAASPASALASHARQLMMVVRADRTTEADLREALGLLSACKSVSLLLNGAAFAATGRRFGSYYGYGQ